MKSRTLHPKFGEKHQAYISAAKRATIAVAEGAVRAGKTIDNITAFAWLIESGTPDRVHLATGSTAANAKMNIGDCNGYGLEHIFRGRCKWSKYRGNEALVIKAHGKQYVVIFAGGGKADSYKKIRGNSYGMWIATEINLHTDSTIKEAFNRQLAARDRHIFWDLNPTAPRDHIYTEYIDLFPAQFGDRYRYEHFTIRDNATISPERLREIEMQYTPGSVWYRRDILGERCTAEGAVYSDFVDRPQDFILDAAPDITYANIGVDFGGGTSGHAFQCVGFSHRFKEMVVLEEYYEQEAINPAKLEADFVAFARDCCKRYNVAGCYVDSAEQTLRNGLQLAAAKAGLPITVNNARKKPINDRIRCACRLQAAGRFFIMRHCKTTIDAYSSAVWNAKVIDKDERLDDGTSNIDTLDATEYAYEREIRSLMEYVPPRRPELLGG